MLLASDNNAKCGFKRIVVFHGHLLLGLLNGEDLGVLSSSVAVRYAHAQDTV